MEHLRDKTRQYVADKKAAIELQNTAAAIGDAQDVLGATSSMIQSGLNIADTVSRPYREQAKADLGRASTEASAKVLEYQNKYGEDIILPENEEKLKQELAVHFTSKRGDYKYDSATSIYDKGMDDFINDTISANQVFATKTKIARQNAERKAATQAQKDAAKRYAESAQGIGAEYIKQSGQLGGAGFGEDFKKLTSEISPTLEKALAKGGTPEQREQMKLAIYEGAVQNHIINALSSENPAVRQNMDYALNNQEAFDRVMPEEYVQGHVDLARTSQLRQWENEKTRLLNEAADISEDSGRAKNIRKQIEKIDEKISELAEDNEIDGKDFDEIAKEDLRKALLQTVEPLARKNLGERNLKDRLAAFNAQKQRTANAIMNPYDPAFQMDLDFLASKEKQSAQMTKVKKNKDGSYSAVEEMSYVGGEKPKGFWEQFASDYRGYRDQMSKVSNITRSSYDTKAQVNAGLRELMYMPTETDTGDPVDFEKAAMSFLYKMSAAPLTESERRHYADFVGQMLLSDNEQVQMARELLESGDVGIYRKNSTRGVRAFEAADLPLDDPRQGGGISGTVRLSDERGMVPDVAGKNGGTAYYERDKGSTFEKAMARAQADYQTQAVNMMVSGATREEVMLRKQEIFSKAIDDYYRSRHVVDLRALDDKLEKHLPAFQEIDGVVYEYKGRDSIGRPLWFDHGVLNTNRDLHRLFDKQKMVGGNATNVAGSSVKREDIAKPMGEDNE